MFFANGHQMSEIASAVTNSKVSHSSFRLYTLLVMAADRSVPKGSFNLVGYEELMALLPGVNGKPVVLSTIKANLRELHRLGLIETVRSDEPRRYVLVKVNRRDYVNPQSVGERILYERVLDQ